MSSIRDAMLIMLMMDMLDEESDDDRELAALLEADSLSHTLTRPQRHSTISSLTNSYTNTHSLTLNQEFANEIIKSEEETTTIIPMKKKCSQWVIDVQKALTHSLTCNETNTVVRLTNARNMKAYVKGNFDFYGIKTPERKLLTSGLLKRNCYPNLDQLSSVCVELWSLSHREYQLVAMDLLRKYEKDLIPNDILWIESLIVNKSWWDSVDFLAIHCLGHIYRAYPEETKPILIRYRDDCNMWLNRCAILTQAKSKQDTNPELLKEIIIPHMHSEEFFIRKAIGWALREYGRIDGEWVKSFVSDHSFELSLLSQREALKNLSKKEKKK
jgi:3-methyladenine DNA glycosylase AlkD